MLKNKVRYWILKTVASYKKTMERESANEVIVLSVCDIQKLSKECDGRKYVVPETFEETEETKSTWAPLAERDLDPNKRLK